MTSLQQRRAEAISDLCCPASDPIPLGSFVALTLVAVFATGCSGAAGVRGLLTERWGAVAAARSLTVRRQGYIEGIAFSECLGCLGLEGATTAFRVA